MKNSRENKIKDFRRHGVFSGKGHSYRRHNKPNKFKQIPGGFGSPRCSNFYNRVNKFHEENIIKDYVQEVKEAAYAEYRGWE